MPSTTLAGTTTASGWTVNRLISSNLGSGGAFCVRYEVTGPDGTEGFMKAMDLSRAAHQGLRAIRDWTSAYLFEQDILEHCASRRMSRIVTPLDVGQITVPNFAPPINEVYYIIFEKAEGDLRQKHLEAATKSWLMAFKALHNVVVGAHQLQMASIAHQDIKPSNVLCFDQDISKLGDLGRVTDAQGKSPYNNSPFPGDLSYRPPEILHGVRPARFVDRYLSDIFMLGSLTYHIIADVQISFVLDQEAQKINPTVKTLPYNDALPIYQSAFATITRRFETFCVSLFGESVAEKLVDIVTEMCNPDHEQRGSPRGLNATTRLSMARYVGKFATLVRTAKVNGIS